MTTERETACLCGGEAAVRGLCRRCYQRDWHAQHPGRRAEYNRRWWERHGEGYNASRRRAPLEPRVCPVCGETFTPTTASQVFCPPNEDERARVGPNTQPRSRCAKRADNARYRATYRPQRSYT